jgi:hypothetical protein
MHIPSVPLDLHEWHEFYLLLGTAAAALVALLFVAVSIGVGYLTPGRTTATRVFISPVVIHFSSVLLMCAVALTPAKVPLLIEIVIGLNAIAGFVVSCVILSQVMRSAYQDVVFIDNLAYGVGPALGYLVIFAAMWSAARGWEWSLHLLATGMLILLMVNIRNAWDMMLTLVRRQGENGDE